MGKMKTFKVTVWTMNGYTHEHKVKAGNKNALERRLRDMEIINGREYVQIEEIGGMKPK